jgi:DNA-binding CsgD family transcriptional regulator
MTGRRGRRIGKPLPTKILKIEGLPVFPGPPLNLYSQPFEARADRTRAAVAANVARETARVANAVTLRAAGLSVAQIALRLHVRERTVERYFEAQKTPTARRAVRRDDEIPG